MVLLKSTHCLAVQLEVLYAGVLLKGLVTTHLALAVIVHFMSVGNARLVFGATGGRWLQGISL